MIKSWQKTGSEYLGDFRIFRIRADSSRSPRTGIVHRFFVLESPDWVNVIPLTSEGKVVMIRQFRHGTEDVTLEVPGGMVDREDGDSSVSAARELREETGYEGARSYTWAAWPPTRRSSITVAIPGWPATSDG